MGGLQLLLTTQVMIKVATIGFILEDVLVDSFMTGRYSTKKVKPLAYLFRTPVQIEQLFNYSQVLSLKRARTLDWRRSLVKRWACFGR